MIDLPRPLAPYRALLDLFAPDVAEGLGPLLPSLALAIGPMKVSRPPEARDGEPDGFTGLSRRGSYERLLLTEWLFADEAPLEFTRRAATGEHAFFQVARRTPARSRSSVALFDAGPDQLGAPRAAHLAALIVLATRAEQSGARFAWGLLHAPDQPLLTAVTKESVHTLLAGRTAIGASAEDMAAWIDRAARSGWEDAWIVGARTIVDGWKHSTIAVRDPCDPARRSLSLTARPRGAAAREIELDLPPDRVTARLLVDPFAPAKRAPPTTSRAPIEDDDTPVSNLVFAPNGTKLFARTKGGSVVSFPVGPGRPKRFRPRNGGVVAAVGWVARGLVMLVIEGRTIVVEHTSRNGPPMLSRSFDVLDDVKLTAPDVTDPLSPLALVDENGATIYFTDAHGALLQITRDRLSDVDPPNDDQTGRAFVHEMAAEVTAMMSLNGHVFYVARGLPSERGWHLVTGHGASAPRVPLEGNGTFEAHFGCRRGGTSSLVAVQRHDDLWTIYQDGQPFAELTSPEGARVIGPWRAGSQSDEPTLIALDVDLRGILQIGGTGAVVLERSSTPIEHAVISAATDDLAYVTLSGEVVIRKLASDVRVARFEPKHVR